jgi:transposase
MSDGHQVSTGIADFVHPLHEVGASVPGERSEAHRARYEAEGFATQHECTLVQGLFDFMLTEQMPERIIGDKAYDSDPLDEAMAEQGVEMIVPHRGDRKPENIAQDGRPLRRYARRWTVERTIGGFQNFRRLCIRWEESSQLFQGYLHLGCTLLLLNQILG